MRILYVWNDRATARYTREQLRLLEVTFDAFSETEEAFEALATLEKYDAVILDVENANTQAIDVINRLASDTSAPPILVTFDANDLQLAADALAVGAVDLLVRPFERMELLLRLRRVMVMSSRSIDAEPRAIELGPLRFNLETREVALDGKPVALTRRDRRVLEVLLEHHGNPISKEKIAAQVFSAEDAGIPQTIESYVYRLRNKIKHPSIEIATVRGLGYKLRLRVESANIDDPLDC